MVYNTLAIILFYVDFVLFIDLSIGNISYDLKTFFNIKSRNCIDSNTCFDLICLNLSPFFVVITNWPFLNKN